MFCADAEARQNLNYLYRALANLARGRRVLCSENTCIGAAFSTAPKHLRIILLHEGLARWTLKCNTYDSGGEGDPVLIMNRSRALLTSMCTTCQFSNESVLHVIKFVHG